MGRPVTTWFSYRLTDTSESDILHCGSGRWASDAIRPEAARIDRAFWRRSGFCGPCRHAHSRRTACAELPCSWNTAKPILRHRSSSPSSPGGLGIGLDRGRQPADGHLGTRSPRPDAPICEGDSGPATSRDSCKLDAGDWCDEARDTRRAR